jgi:hypothetical protein
MVPPCTRESLSLTCIKWRALLSVTRGWSASTACTACTCARRTPCTACARWRPTAWRLRASSRSRTFSSACVPPPRMRTVTDHVVMPECVHAFVANMRKRVVLSVLTILLERDASACRAIKRPQAFAIAPVCLQTRYILDFTAIVQCVPPPTTPQAICSPPCSRSGATCW